VQSSIEGKLTALLADPVDTEAKAVYLLCQVRKLQDYDKAGPNRLRMFCNWAVHVELDARSTVEPFLQHIDDVVASKLSGAMTPQSFAAELALQDDFAAFDTFRKELRDVLAYHNIPTTVCDDDGWWYGFLEHYSGVIEDCTLTLKRPLQNLTSVKFVKQQSGVNPAALTFAPTWVVNLSSPHKGHWYLEFSAEPFAGMTTKAWGHRFI
jgi:hypothetical protein